jgi:hypothetical protein
LFAEEAELAHAGFRSKKRRVSKRLEALAARLALEHEVEEQGIVFAQCFEHRHCGLGAVFGGQPAQRDQRQDARQRVIGAEQQARVPVVPLESWRRVDGGCAG